jgi:hypothetical protein
MENMEYMANALYSATIGYFKQQKTDGKEMASSATNFSGNYVKGFRKIVDACGEIIR